MNKIFLLMAGALLGSALTSCDTSTDPKYHEATSSSFQLNIPAMSEQYIELTPGATLELVATSQPNYGISTVCAYSVQMSLTSDFSSYYSIGSQDGSQTKMVISQSEVAIGVCDLLGYDSSTASKYETDYPDGFPFMTVYFRGVCKIYNSQTNADVEGSEVISSNYVAYQHLKPYFAVPVPGSLYLIGNPEGWNITDAGNWILKEADDAIGSKIYSGVFEMTADQAYEGFRFYTELGDWGNDGELPSIGAAPNDGDNQEVAMTDGVFQGQAVYGKGNWKITNFPGGEMTIIVNLSNPSAMSVQFIAGAAEVFTPRYMYVMGQVNSSMRWEAPSPEYEEYYNNYRLVDPNESGIYSGSFPVEPMDAYFRFCFELTEDGWDNTTQIASQEPDESTTVTLTGNTYEGPYVLGKGSWYIKFDTAGTIDFNVDTNTTSVTFVFTPEE